MDCNPIELYRHLATRLHHLIFTTIYIELASITIYLLPFSLLNLIPQCTKFTWFLVFLAIFSVGHPACLYFFFHDILKVLILLLTLLTKFFQAHIVAYAPAHRPSWSFSRLLVPKRPLRSLLISIPSLW